ncbi:MAG: UPF0182 family membrane protein [Gemmatimonadaceae bacterium]
MTIPPYEPPIDLGSFRQLPPRPKRRFRKWIVLFLVVFFGLIPWLIGAATDWLWFKELGYQTVFWTELNTRGALFGIGGLLTFAFLYGNLRLAQRGPVTQPILLANPTGPPVDVVAIVGKLSLPLALVLSFLFGVSLSALWMTVLQASYGVTVGTADPIFGRDISYYLFTLPLAAAVLNVLISLTVLSLLATTAMYWVRGDLILPPRRPSVERPAAFHIGGMLAFLFVLVAIRLWAVSVPGLVYSTTGPLFGASYTDTHATLPALNLSAIVALLSAALVVWGMVRGKLVWFGAVAIALYLAVAIVGRGVFPFAMQKLLVAPNELNRETPYLGHHIKATREAWGLDHVTTRDLSGEDRLSMADITANPGTIENVRLWERDLLAQTFGSLQEIRLYYDFVQVDDDRYMIDGRYRQVHLSAREMNTSLLPTKTFINERLTFTHGMGLTMAPVNQVTQEGLPVLFIKDLPPASVVSLKITRPQIYFGELTQSYAFVNTGQPEFDYPSGDQNIFTSYKGSGGVPIGSFAKKLLFAWHFQSLKLLLSNDVSPQSRVMYDRDIPTRVRKALPFLSFDGDPYLVLNEAGELKWFVDAYTTSGHYPYSQPRGDGVNYMRNSVKLVIDAYQGKITAYVADPADPLIRTYGRIFGGIFQPLSAMPADLRRHVRYPTDLFEAQTTLYSTYHMVDAHTFYHREDQWQMPRVATEAEHGNPFMRHVIMRLPGEQAAEYIYMSPFTPRGKDNLASWMVARNDGERYGELIVYRFPKQSLVFGPRQIMNRINQDTEISRQVTLWDQSGSEVIKGELLVIPIEESLIYVQPLYTRARGGTIPEMKRVIVAYQNHVVMEETLEQGLARLFGAEGDARAERAGRDVSGAAAPVSGAPPAAVPATPAPVASVGATLAQRAQQHYDRALAAQRSGDWATYGEEIRRLGEVLRQLRP